MPSKREEIISYVYKNVKLTNFRYKVVTNEEVDLAFLKLNPHYVGLNYYGTSSLLVFIKLQDNYYSVIINRKTLTYNKDKIVLEKVNIEPVVLEIQSKLYKGTILDGIMYVNGATRIFIITDVYFVAGVDFTAMDYKQKLETIQSKMIPKIKFNKKSNFKIIVDKPFVYNQLPKISELEKKSKDKLHDLKTRGLIFYPKTSGQKYIYVMNENDKKKESSDSSDSESSNESDSEKGPKKTTAIFYMKNGSKSGIYDLFLKDKDKIYRKIGIADVSKLKIGTLCESLLKDEDRTIVSCKYNDSFKKWTPVEFSSESVSYIKDIYG